MAISRRKGKKVAHRCVNGPLAGQVLMLSTGNTFRFTLNGQSGHYAATAASGTDLHWNPKE